MPISPSLTRLFQNRLTLPALASIAVMAGASAACAGSLLKSEASYDASALCDRAADHAAQATGVPRTVLHAIALTETGRKRGSALRPWPWTVNMEGAGHWFASHAAALSYAQDHFRQGARSFDLGCFQINYRWHGDAFASLDAMFDPDAGALYAARMLRDLHDELGDWSLAAGAYHSRTPKHAERYAARFDRIRTRLAAAAPAATSSPQRPAPFRSAEDPSSGMPGSNGYPLLMAGAKGRMGSLVPVGGGGTQPLFDAIAAPKG